MVKQPPNVAKESGVPQDWVDPYSHPRLREYEHPERAVSGLATEANLKVWSNRSKQNSYHATKSESGQ